MKHTLISRFIVLVLGALGLVMPGLAVPNLTQEMFFGGFSGTSSISLDYDYDAYPVGSTYANTLTVTVEGYAETGSGLVCVFDQYTDAVFCPESFNKPDGGSQAITVTFPSVNGLFATNLEAGLCPYGRITEECTVSVVKLDALTTDASDCGCDEDGTCYVKRKGAGNVIATATVTPSIGVGENLAPDSIVWSAGTEGSDQLHRVISTATAADPFELTATCGADATVHVHIVDAEAPPTNVDCPKSSSLSVTPATLDNDDFGTCQVRIGEDGIVAPTYSVNAYFSDDGRWQFQAQSINHIYKIATQNLGLIEIDNATDTDIDDAAEAQNVVDEFTVSAADEACDYQTYVHMPAIQAHEEAHAERFYSSTFWQLYMASFERTVEDDSFDPEREASVQYNCTSVKTATAAKESKKAYWDFSIAAYHNLCDINELDGSEPYANTHENAVLAPLITAIKAQWGL